jgi:hypothetical protein
MVNMKPRDDFPSFLNILEDQGAVNDLHIRVDLRVKVIVVARLRS